jgi:tRNA threonylcarbamoyladenosine biosynthesis protein TsaE
VTPPGPRSLPPGWSVSAVSDGAAATRRLAAGLAGISRAGDVLLLVGGLGAGKTTFAQGFAAALGIAGPVTSPTFTLVRQYPCAGPAGVGQLVHADVYRLESLAEVLDLGLHELVEDGVLLVEWGDMAAPALGESHLHVALTLPPARPGDAGADEEPDEERLLTITGRGPAWSGRRDEVVRALAGAEVGSDRRR